MMAAFPANGRQVLVRVRPAAATLHGVSAEHDGAFAGSVRRFEPSDPVESPFILATLLMFS
jgi:hypothetical protein